MANICVNLQAFQTYWNILDAFMEKACKMYNPLILFLRNYIKNCVSVVSFSLLNIKTEEEKKKKKKIFTI